MECLFARCPTTHRDRYAFRKRTSRRAHPARAVLILDRAFPGVEPGAPDRPRSERRLPLGPLPLRSIEFTRDVWVEQAVIAVFRHPLESGIPALASFGGWTHDQRSVNYRQLDGVLQVALVNQRFWNPDTARVPDTDQVCTYCHGWSHLHNRM